MSESKAVILGCAGKALSADEIAFYRDERPWGFILFARNIGEPGQVEDLVAALRDSVGRPGAPVFIDQEGGRVQRLRPPVAPNYPSGSALGALHRSDSQAGLRAAWLMARLHAFDLLRLGDTDLRGKPLFRRKNRRTQSDLALAEDQKRGLQTAG